MPPPANQKVPFETADELILIHTTRRTWQSTFRDRVEDLTLTIESTKSRAPPHCNSLCNTLFYPKEPPRQCLPQPFLYELLPNCDYNRNYGRASSVVFVGCMMVDFACIITIVARFITGATMFTTVLSSLPLPVYGLWILFLLSTQAKLIYLIIFLSFFVLLVLIQNSVLTLNTYRNGNGN
jgi:hypothetical protein